ncbi:ABC transporter permease [uncultured Paracoccus sp.]|uniref:ABC transporter permease n=1 Tax=uncultured Paracoccus sp. TaxID=189685 RepID=UPI0026284EAE|nr:ABC transporter permease [uncultured Paracoccus sp.]
MLAVLALWQAAVWLTGLPTYLLPGPRPVMQALIASRTAIAQAAAYTAGETLIGLALGATLGIALALAMATWRPVGRALAPALIVSQAIPIFALAPILTLWLGFGLAPKIAMVVLIVFVPVTQALYDGLMAPPAAQMDVALTMGPSRCAMLRHLRLPAALPRLASGVRLGAIYAPVGAVIGEWIGGARGLGALMLQANGRMKTDLMFAALIVVVALSLALYATVDRMLARFLVRRGFC